VFWSTVPPRKNWVSLGEGTESRTTQREVMGGGDRSKGTGEGETKSAFGVLHWFFERGLMFTSERVCGIKNRRTFRGHTS